MTFHDRRFQIIGRKGGKGGGKGGSDDAENTLRSRARAQLVELICEGPIKGLVGGEQSIYFDETAVRNSNGTLNHKNVKWEFHRGLPDDTYFQGNATAQTPHTVEVQVKKNVGEVVRTIIDANTDDVRVVVRIPQLYKADKKDGSIKPTSLSYRIKYRNYNGSWVVAHTENIVNEKTTSVYQRQHIVSLPAGGAPWDISVERITDDSEDDKLSNELWWESYYTIVKGKFIYPHSAALYLEVNAEDMGSSIPARAVEVEGMIIRVPENYDPETRTYTGLWNGAFKFAYSNNPAWIFYDLITNVRYGLGEFVDENKVDKWSLYQIAQHCDQLVDTGFRDINGVMTQEPRYTYNGVINSREEAFNVLRQIATSWRGMAFWSLGQVFATADMPADPIKLVAPANVIRGEFDYTGVALKAKHSVAIIAWNDPADFYRPATEVVINEDMLKRYGWREKSVTLVGCTSRGLAHRYGKWILDTEQHEDETVTYSASWDQADVKPGDIIALADPNKAQVRLGGRLVECQPTFAMLDFAFKPVEGESYSLMMLRPDGTIVTKAITSFDAKDGDEYYQANFSAIEDPLPQPGAMWVITGTDVEPRRFRVLSLREEKPNEFKIQALFHDPTKYARVENGINLSAPTYTRPTIFIKPPVNLTILERTYMLAGVLRTTLSLSWSNSGDFLARDYVVTMDHPTRGRNIGVGTTEGMGIDINDAVAGEYTFYVKARGYAGNMSEATAFTYTVAGATSMALPVVETLELADNPGSVVFKTTDIRIRWVNWFAASSDPTSDLGVPNDGRSPFYQGNKVKVYDTATNQLLREASVLGETFTYSYGMNTADNELLYGRGPSRAVTFVVTVLDIFGRESLPANLSVSNPAPAAVTLSATTIGNVIFADWTLPAEDDLAGSVLHISETATFTPGPSTLQFDGPGNSVSFTKDPDKIYHLRAAAYDRFGKNLLNFSNEVAVSTGVFVDTDAPDTPTGLSLASEVRVDANNAEYTVLIATWVANEEEDLAYYGLEIKEGTGNFVGFQTGTNRFEIRARGNTSYTARVRAVDRVGNQSDFTATVAHTSATPGGGDPAAAINAGSTQVDPGKIRIAGTTTLADWRTGGDETKINGGAISANTIKANAVEIGLRELAIAGLSFEFNSPAVNQVAWTAGSITYTNDAGSVVTASIAAGNATFSTFSIYIYWTKGGTVLQATTNAATAFDPNNVVLATYGGAKNLIANYGRTIIDGGSIKTGSIEAAQIAAGTISADKLGVTQLSAIAANVGTLTAGVLQSSDGKMQIDLTNKRILIAD